MSKVPTVDEFKHAQKIVTNYNKRQDELGYIKKELSFKLKDFTDVKFRVIKKDEEVIFTGLCTTDGRVKLGVAKCSKGDKFNQDIGKLIAVKKSLGEDIRDIEKLIEKKPFGKMYCTGGILSDTLWIQALQSTIK